MPEEAPLMDNNHQPDGCLTLRIQRMNADRLTIVVEGPHILVEALREEIRQQTNIPVERQRLIFRGRVLKNGERLSTYGTTRRFPLWEGLAHLPLFPHVCRFPLDIHNESVLHLVERPENISQAPPTSGTSTSSTHAAAGDNRRPGIAGATANILLHTMQVDPSAGPAVVAQEISRSVMEALQGVMDGVVAGNSEETPSGAFFPNLFGPFSAAAVAAPGSHSDHETATTGGRTANPAAPAAPAAAGSQFDPFSIPIPIFAMGNPSNARSANTSVPPSGPANSRQSTMDSGPNGPPSSASIQSRLLSRPISTARAQTVAEPPTPLVSSVPVVSSGGHHRTVRTDPRRVLHNLNEELSRLTTFSDGTDLFPSTTRPTPTSDFNRGPLSDVNLLIDNLEHFERAYWMLASGCRELREALQHTMILSEAGTSATLPWDRLANLLALLHGLPLLMVSQERLLGSLRAVPPRRSIELPPSLDVPSFLAVEGGVTCIGGGNITDAGSAAVSLPSNPMDTIEPPE